MTKGFLHGAISLKNRRHFFFFIFGLFFLLLADSIMVYAFPIIVENEIGSNVMMGIVLSFSSVVGILCDFFLPQIFHKKQWRILIYSAITVAAFFPLVTDIGAHTKLVGFFLLGSALWGIYYEFLQFSLQDFIVSKTEKKSYSLDWSVIFALWQINLIIGPILAAYILARSMALTPILFCFFLFSFVAISFIKEKPVHLEQKKTKGTPRISHIFFFKMLKEMNYWKALSRVVIWVLLMSFCLSLNQALFQTIGGAFGSTLFTDPFMQSLVVVLYNASYIPAMALVPLIGIRTGKKKVAVNCLFIGGLILSTLAFTHFPSMILLIIFCSSLFVAFSSPLVESVYSELLGRSGRAQIHLLSLQKVSVSLAYILGPTIIGKIADLASYRMTFSIIGLLSAFISIFLWFKMPRKVKLPQDALAKLNSL